MEKEKECSEILYQQTRADRLIVDGEIFGRKMFKRQQPHEVKHTDNHTLHPIDPEDRTTAPIFLHRQYNDKHI